MFKKILLILIIFSAVLGFFHYDLHTLLTLDGLKSSMAEFDQQKAKTPFLVITAFFVFYVLITALSLPGAAILTLAAGALFGLVEGLIIVSFASSIGALLAFLVARFILRNTVKNKFPEKLKAIDEGVKREGAFYLFTLRLVPVFPFFLINLLMGLTAIRSWTFYWVSQVGMLAGTVVYVNAGTQLAELESLSGILSPTLILSFVLLGIFPWLAKGLIALINRQKVYLGYRKPKRYDRNLIVIGAGAGGLVSSYIGAAVKAKVTLVEAGEMGGDCLNYGCVPSKAIIKSAKLAYQQKHADQYGLTPSNAPFSFKNVMQRVHRVISEVAPHDSVERYTNLGVDVQKGYANIIDPWTVEIALNDGSKQTLTSKNIVIATGARPFVPPLPGLDEVGYLTSDTLWQAYAELDEVPKRIVVLGGGPIGCELAQAFARLGSEVTQVEMADRIMLREDPEVSELAEKTLQKSGVNILTGHKAKACRIENGQKVIQLETESGEKNIEFDSLICAVGRSARLEGFGLQALGIETGRTIKTNEYLQTKYPNIFAVGDVVGPYQFTHVAGHQAWYAAVNALFGRFKRFKVDYRVIPWTTFIDPEVARVGLNETQAKEKGIAYEVTRFDLAELDRAIAESSTTGFIKVLTPPGKDTILGVTLVSEYGGDILAEFVLAMKHGLGLNKVLGTIHAYPTWAEVNKYAAGEWKRANAPQTLLNWVEKYHRWMRS
ncbi:FAD-dependent oxidoreductase [Catenovulum adriaticum]|uniref:FAD-dependent oxidoreductase n=1 Tax=Catenovulum adriaticum TaxID=2984846 RepID=A0ABY7AQ57_9ALTE|nr:bifunctional TVP38/TMEM64 family protein/FAD-dependent oxidoreductase [Catenovulum sp. TS8]WAJ71692.1 FAD-dependent oxidoreductase [Catenovulum sp. TS8]